MACNKQSHDKKTIYIYIQGVLTRIPVEEVIYLKADNKYVTIRTAECRYLTPTSLNTFEDALPALFVRIHRNALVSLPRAHGLTNDYNDHVCVCFEDIEDVLTISRRRVTFINKKLAALNQVQTRPQSSLNIHEFSSFSNRANV